MKAKRWIGLGLTCVLLGSSLAGCGNATETTAEQEKSSGQNQKVGDSSSATGDAWTLAETTTYEPYPETVEFSVGVRVRADVAYPEGTFFITMHDSTTEMRYAIIPTRLHMDPVFSDQTNERKVKK